MLLPTNPYWLRMPLKIPAVKTSPKRISLIAVGLLFISALALVSALGASAQVRPSPDSSQRDHSIRDHSSKKTSNSEAVAVPHGTLIIVGGGVTPRLRRRFSKLAGGAEAEIVCVPTALPHGRLSGWCRRFFRQAGVPKKNRTVLHTRKRKKANKESFVQPLQAADAVWFTGGRQWRLVEAYAGTRAFEAFHGVLERGGVIGGTSAGASIQGSFLIRGDPSSKKIVVGKYKRGFGFLPNSAIDQHLRARDREKDLVKVVKERPRLLGIGIDEGTAAIVQGDTLRVVGEGLVAIYDAERINAERTDQVQMPRSDREAKPRGKPYFFLEPGDRFDLRTRRVLPAPAAQPPEAGQ